MSQSSSSRTARRRGRTMAIAVATAVAVLVGVGGSPSFAAKVAQGTGIQTGAADVSTIDLANPTAGITDPAAGLEVLDRNCKSGQVDINTAASAEIAKELGVSSSPTLNRLLATRPFLRAIDAVSVPGVGPSKAPALASKFCATPTKLPPDAPNAPKARFTGVDLQTATAEEIASLGLLSRETATRLADYGPLPQDLHTVASPAIPGLSDPLIDRLLASGKIAITPQPFFYEGSTWKWVSQDHGAIIRASDDLRYALYVPSGLLNGLF